MQGSTAAAKNNKFYREALKIQIFLLSCFVESGKNYGFSLVINTVQPRLQTTKVILINAKRYVIDVV